MIIHNLIDTDDNESLGLIISNLDGIELQNKINTFKGVCYLSDRKKSKKDMYNYDPNDFCRWMQEKNDIYCAVFIPNELYF